MYRRFVNYIESKSYGTLCDIAFLHHASQVIKHQMLLLAEKTKKTTESGMRMMADRGFFMNYHMNKLIHMILIAFLI